MPAHIQAGLAKQGLFIAATTIEVDGDYSRIQLFPYGEFRASDGRPADVPQWIIADDNGADICTVANSYTNKHVVDYEHQTLKAAENGQPAPAAGWMDYFYLTPKGVFAEVTWTDKAKEMITAGEYKYISPVFVYDKNGYVRKILNAALTNNPALDGMDEVVAACLGCESNAAALNELLTTQEKEQPMLELLKIILGLPDDATEADATALLTRLQEQSSAANIAVTDVFGTVAALTSQASTQPDPAKFVPVETVAEMQKQIAVLTVQQAKKTADDMVQAALTAGKLLPAQKDWALAYCAQDADGFAKYIDAAQPVAALTGTQTAGKTHDGDNVVALSAEQEHVRKSMGMSTEQFQKLINQDN
ncbi:MAG: phage protease [Gammaproteobacteria bacterium]|nr:phage protease [Gammaproteobacteria bacterium]